MNRKQILENRIFNLEVKIQAEPNHRDVDYMKDQIMKLKELLEKPKNDLLDIGVKGKKVSLFVKQFEFTRRKRGINDEGY